MKIEWKKFFSGGKSSSYHCYYMSIIYGVRAEKHTFKGGVEFSIGNMDNAKIKYKNEAELITAITDKTSRL